MIGPLATRVRLRRSLVSLNAVDGSATSTIRHNSAAGWFATMFSRQELQMLSDQLHNSRLPWYERSLKAQRHRKPQRQE